MKGKTWAFTRRQATTSVAAILLTVAGIAAYVFDSFCVIATGSGPEGLSVDRLGGASIALAVALVLWDAYLERRAKAGAPALLLDDESWERAYVVATVFVLSFLGLVWVSVVGGLLVEQRGEQDKMSRALRRQGEEISRLQAPPAVPARKGR